ncbi:hypothetical protein FGIG_09362 [Fasciola gigantica]|uniref:Secreted protein n=1 Tax=Fasciola gigantica TaxID=46835 RepID=A0A504YGS2_FASGI|nr:hypothetical protein FGIG_09362 [Fasciola gigantica]
MTLALHMIVVSAVLTFHTLAHQIPIYPVEVERHGVPTIPFWTWYTDYVPSRSSIYSSNAKRAHFDPILFRKRQSTIDPILF